jgi:hypothetical protein
MGQKSADRVHPEGNVSHGTIDSGLAADLSQHGNITGDDHAGACQRLDHW